MILFDKRGTGLSDRVGEIPTLEQRMDDVRAVMDATGTDRAAIFGYSEGGPMSLLFAATYPERTSALILYAAMAKRAWAVDYPWGRTREEMESRLGSVEQTWGTGASVDIYAPSHAGDDHYRKWMAGYERSSASPGAVLSLIRMNMEIDVRHVLPAIRVPTLVLHRTGDRASGRLALLLPFTVLRWRRKLEGEASRRTSDWSGPPGRRIVLSGG